MSEFTADEVRVLKALAAVALGSGTAPSRSGPIQALPDDKLDNDWADKIIKKDPPRYKGPSFVGNRYSAATPEWHDVNADYFAWKADKGRSETPVRTKDNGKPWYESDEFEAKLSLAWAKRLRERGPTPTAADELAATTTDDEIPF